MNQWHEYLKKTGIKASKVGDLDRRAAPSPPSLHDESSTSAWLEGIEISQQFSEIQALLESGCPLLFVSGKAGTGKTTLVHYVRQALRRNLVVVAPTGVAALNAGGMTIHSFFRFPPRIVVDTDIRRFKNKPIYKKLEILVIDEISMVRADLLDAIDRFLRENGPNPEQPFGGVQMLLVGDLFQLPPVTTRGELKMLQSMAYRSPFFFSAHCLAPLALVHVELTKGYRQTDPEFTALLNQVRVAEDVEAAIGRINVSCYARAHDGEGVIALTSTNAAAEEINATELARLSGPEETFQGTIKGRFGVEEDRLPAPLELRLRAGAQVMITRNDVGHKWVNGTLAKVHSFANNKIRIELLSGRFAGEVHDLGRAEWESFRYEYEPTAGKILPSVAGSFSQFPVILAWAVTIHKSQGKTLDKVRIDLGHGAFAAGQVYVALSRCRKLEDIALVRPLREREITCDSRIKRFYAALQETSA